MDRIKRLSTEILSQYRDNFGTDFSANKNFLNEVTIVRSKSLKNEIAGYITKILLREERFQAHKQKLIDDEKKFLEKNQVEEKKASVASEPEPEPVASEPEPEPVASEPEPEPVASEPEPESQSPEEKTLAEEVLNDVEKSE